ncbi:RES family NAD+ phosphorylase [Vibrio brasiliensis]|uniref:RES family NAD+ phosphorylase n=1 Tax=Vibrio brasiliensis TaxID=170652 RepID=UPI001EFDAC7D|nr:RES family NAD+ phosphorylase [Vibrio brasiliensis]MCG9782653.1 RES family NAD+ phosphorylase [Vibrio brasiliensis]
MINMRNNEIEASVGLVCSNCNEDTFYFNTKNKELPSEKACVICSEVSLNGILIEDFIFTLSRHIENHYELSDNKSCETFSLEQVLARFTIDNKDFLELLSKVICEADSKCFKRDGIYKSKIDQKFIDECKRDAEVEWDKYSKELKHSRRFTHKDASDYYTNLISTCVHRVESISKKDQKFNSAKRVIEKGTVLYRGRITSNEIQKQQFQSDPNKHLGAAPAPLAANNRMSPPGISFMYTANSPKTAIAELRPYVGDTIAVGSFTTQRDLTFFDFTLLDSVELKEANILTNPTQDKYYKNGYLLHLLHGLISKPFRETSLNYIQSQMFAETIRSYDKGIFDGLIFNSSQLEGGVNYVIFGKNSDDEYSDIEYNVKANPAVDVAFYTVETMTPSIREISSK